LLYSFGLVVCLRISGMGKRIAAVYRVKACAFITVDAHSPLMELSVFRGANAPYGMDQFLIKCGLKAIHVVRELRYVPAIYADATVELGPDGEYAILNPPPDLGHAGLWLKGIR